METFALAALIGIAIGLLSGLLGVGGGTIMVPVFRLVFGLPPVAATATSLFTIIPTSISGAVSHLRGRTCLPRLGLALGVGGALTSSLGAWLATVSPGWLVMAAAALVIGYSSITMFQKALKGPANIPSKPAPEPDPDPALTAERDSHRIPAPVTEFDPAPTAEPESPCAPASAPEPDPADERAAAPSCAPTLALRDYLKAGLIGAAAGLASGYVGLGGGFLMVPLMLSLLNLPMRLASGISLIAIMILAVPASITQIALGNVDFPVALATALGSIPGAFLGARLTSRIPERQLRFTFAAFLLAASILLVVNEIGA